VGVSTRDKAKRKRISREAAAATYGKIAAAASRLACSKKLTVCGLTPLRG
jgi:hypothetical protein